MSHDMNTHTFRKDSHIVAAEAIAVSSDAKEIDSSIGGFSMTFGVFVSFRSRGIKQLPKLAVFSKWWNN